MLFAGVQQVYEHVQTADGVSAATTWSTQSFILSRERRDAVTMFTFLHQQLASLKLLHVELQLSDFFEKIDSFSYSCSLTAVQQSVRALFHFYNFYSHTNSLQNQALTLYHITSQTCSGEPKATILQPCAHAGLAAMHNTGITSSKLILIHLLLFCILIR